MYRHERETLTFIHATLTLECWCIMDFRSGLAKLSLCWWNVAGVALASLEQQTQLSCVRHMHGDCQVSDTMMIL